MTLTEIDKKMDRLAEKRNYAADVLNKPLLAWSYQKEIDTLAEQRAMLVLAKATEPPK